MLVGDGGNIVVQTGDQGAFVVDTGEGKMSEKVIAAIRTLSDQADSVHRQHELPPRAYWRQRGTRRSAGQDPSLPGSFFLVAAPRGVTGFFDNPLTHATMMAHVNVQVRMQAAGAPAGAVPADTYLDDRRRKFHNGDAIELFSSAERRNRR